MNAVHKAILYGVLMVSLSAACAVACLFSPRVRGKPVLHPVHVLPAIYIVSTLTAATLMTLADPRQLLGTLATVAAGVVAYAYIRRANPIGFRAPDPDSDAKRSL